MEQHSEAPKGKTPQQWAKYWAKEHEAAKKRTRKFQKQGNKINQRYLDERAGNNQVDDGTYEGFRGDIPSKFNLFHKNISTLQNMLYGQTPKQDVSREHQDPDDDIARVAALIIKRILEADYEPSGEDVSTVLKAALQDRLIPGLGMARVRYECTTCTVMAVNDQGEQVEEQQLLSEDAPIDYVHWQDVLWGWGRTWGEIPWWGFRSWLTKEEATQRFGEKVAKGLEYKNQTPSGTDKTDETFDSDLKNNVQKAEIWEFWKKSDRKVYWWSQGQDKILDVKDDPLGLRGFWPMPKPLVANCTTTLFMPKADFVIAQDLYNEIDELQSRISVITRAVKVIGVYDQSAGDSVGRMFKEGVENDLIPVDNWAMFGEKGGLQGSIDWFPVQEVVATLQTLAQVQEAKIAQLNEVTGMSEIMRGAAGGQYTAAASNQLAAKMGSIDVQALQDEFARFASDLEALKAEVVARHFEPRTIIVQSNAQFLPQADRDKMMQAIQLIKSPQSKWRVNIRPETIAMIDYAQLKQERTEFLGSMATFIQSAQAAVKEFGPEATPVLLEMMKWTMASFKGSDVLEGTMDRAIEMAIQKAQQPQKEDPAAQKAQADLKREQMRQETEKIKIQGDLQKIQMKSQADMRSIGQKVQGEIAKIRADAQRDENLENMQSQYALLEIAEELQASLTEIAAQTESALAIEREQGRVDMLVDTAQHGHKMTEIRAQGGPNE